MPTTVRQTNLTTVEMETFDACRDYGNREQVKQRRFTISSIKKAYKNRRNLSRYNQISLFQEQQGSLCRRPLHYLLQWLEKYNSTTTRSQRWISRSISTGEPTAAVNEENSRARTDPLHISAEQDLGETHEEDESNGKQDKTQVDEFHTQPLYSKDYLSSMQQCGYCNRVVQSGRDEGRTTCFIPFTSTGHSQGGRGTHTRATEKGSTEEAICDT